MQRWSEAYFLLNTAFRYLSTELWEIMDPVIKRNRYFGHPENLLLAMICDQHEFVREIGLCRILKARTLRAGEQGTVRQFCVPKMNLNATNYFELINWHDVTITEPPLTTDISDENIKQFVKSGGKSTTEFERFPCHTNSPFKRCVKMVTEASLAVCGHLSRDCFICARLEGRRLMPKFKTKGRILVQYLAIALLSITVLKIDKDNITLLTMGQLCTKN